MQETVRITLKIDGADAQVSWLSSAGIVFSHEISAPPRGMSFILEPGNPITEFRMRRVRQIQDWQPQEFHLVVGVEGNAIVCQGVNALSLPPGAYRLRVAISDLQERDQPVDIEVPEKGTANVTLNFVDDPRRVVVTTPVAEFDQEIRRVLEAPQSMLDGITAAQWLASPLPRPRRKACLMNLLATLRATHGPQLRTSLASDVSSIFFADVDRIYSRVTADFYANLRALSSDPNRPFYFEGSPKAPVHAQLLEQIAEWETDARLFHLMSFRQEGKPSMQAVVAVPPAGDVSRAHYADHDIDLGNPLQDVEGALIHFGELLSPGKTDHLKLAEKLSSGPTAEFLYYSVTTANAATG